MEILPEGHLRFYDRDGKPITMGDWVKKLEDHDYVVVKLTELGGFRVSTVWLGFDHRFHSRKGSDPILFETIVFGPKGSVEEQQRYTTEAEARAGHDQTVARWRAAGRTFSGDVSS